MWWALILLVTTVFVLATVIFHKLWYIKYSLLNQRETYIILFAFFSMWILGLIDDWLNIKWVGKVKWLTAKMKLIWMFLFSGFIAYWMHFKLGVDYVILWDEKIHIWFLYFIITFIFTVLLVNAVNITDGLDGLAGWIIVMILMALGVMTYFQHWYLATTVIAIIAASLIAFLWYNINPAKIFMWDSGSLAFGGLIAAVIYLLGIKLGIWTIIIPLLFLLFVELASSFLQIFWKKTFKRKLFSIAPFHHNLENKWYAEYTIVMKFWLIQAVLTALALVIFFYQVMH
jgi:phospho-N-acetylmuramoyl-pentapeptide-transferase